jgi:serpin B
VTEPRRPACHKSQMAIADVYHNTVVAIDEKGVEAAAATAIVVNDSDGGIFPDVTFAADRPFLFAIRDRGTDSLLWFGRVLTPS